MSSNCGIDTVKTRWWGHTSISSRDYSYPIKEHKGSKAAAHDYILPKSAGKGVIIYCLEQKFKEGNNFKLPVVPKRLNMELWDKNKKFDGVAESEMHGSIVANIAGGDRDGAAPKATIYPVILDLVGSETDTDQFNKALEAILKHFLTLNSAQPAILCTSFGAPAGGLVGSYSTITKVAEAGILIVASAGNRSANVTEEECNKIPRMAELYEKSSKLKEEKKELSNEEQKELEKLKGNFVYEILPAAHPSVLSVGGLDQENNCTGYAYGTGVDIHAPSYGVPISQNEAYEPLDIDVDRTQGTSFAAPLVAGSIACIISDMIAKDPNALGTATSRPKFLKDLVKQWSRKIEQDVDGKIVTFLAYKNVERPKDEISLPCTTPRPERKMSEDKTRAINDFGIRPKRKNT